MSQEERALSDVRRKIKEVMEKEGNKIVFGYRGEVEPTRTEGDVWESVDGKKWTIKNGIKQTVTKLDTAKTPWFCPKCDKAMPHKLDTKFWRIRGKCMDCVIKEETHMRNTGQWAEYERKILLRNYIASLEDRIAELQDYHDTFSIPEIIHADDTKILMQERWNIDVDTAKKEILDEIERATAHLKETIEEHGDGHD